MRTVGAGRYTLHEQIGAGGMATVWAAFDARLRVWRAVKVLGSEASPTVRARFEREARAMARLRHRHVLPLHDILEEWGQLFLVMDLAPGGSLADWVARHGPMGPRTAVEVTMAVLDALSLAHREGVVHRDVKPGNVLLAADGAVLVADFGIARLADDERATKHGAGFGTPAFAPPEQRKDAAHADARADVYSTGATLWYLLTARFPWDVDQQAPEAWVHLGVPRPIGAVLARATRSAPAERFAGADEMRAALVELLPTLHPDPETPPLGSPERTTRPAPAPETTLATTLTITASTDVPPARGRIGWGVGAAAATGLALGVLALGWGWGRGPRPPETWRVEPDPDASGRIYSRDGGYYRLVDGVVARGVGDGPAEGIPGCTARFIADASDDRILLARDDPRRFDVVDRSCRPIRSEPDDELSTEHLLDPRDDGIVRVDYRGVSEGAERLVLKQSMSGQSVAVSPSGRFVAWVERSEQRGPELRVLDRDDRSVRQLFSDDGLCQILAVGAVAFLDEDRLVVARARGATTEVVLVEAGKIPRVLGAIPDTPVEAIRVASGGFAIDTVGARYDIDGIDPGGPPTRWVDGPGSDRPSGFRADGGLLYSSDELGTWDVWERRVDGTRAVVVGGPEDDASAVESAQGLLWLRTRREDGQTAIMARGPDGADRELVALGPHGGRLTYVPPPSDLALDCAGRSCISAERVGDDLVVHTLDPETGALGPGIRVPGGAAASVGPDGVVLVASAPASTQVTVLDPSGPRELVDLDRVVQTARPVAGRWLVSGPSSGWYVGWVGPDHRVVEVRHGPHWLGSPRVSADAQRIAWLVTTEGPTAWRLVPSEP